MRYFEIAGGIRIDISEEERDLLVLANSNVLEEELDERTQEVALQMVSKGLLVRHEDDDKAYYTPNGLENIGRF
jgi:UDP-N-acetylglucosamine transferase subunit ALG13